MVKDYEQIQIYPGVAPGSKNLNIDEEWFEEQIEDGRMKQIVQNVTVPTVMPFLGNCLDKKYNDNSDGIAGDIVGKKPAVLVIPGGGYRRLVMNHEGVEIAEWLNGLGFAAFVLKCRLPVNEHENRDDVALMDAQRAIRLIRSHADEWNIDVDRIGVMGFSAGGSIASTVSTCYDKQVYEPIDEVDKLSARPDFCVLGYPAVSAEVEIEARKRKDKRAVPEYLMNVIKKYSTDKLVTKDTPPTFIMETDDDTTTLSEHSVQYYLACRKAGVPAELHVFQTGKHGFGLGDNGTQGQSGQWTSLFVKWAKVCRII